MEKKKEQSFEDFCREMGFEVITVDVGNRVVCDGCNDEYTNSKETGGILLSRSAFCPKCAKQIIASAKKYKEEQFLTYPKEGETFYDFVMHMRDIPSDYQK